MTTPRRATHRVTRPLILQAARLTPDFEQRLAAEFAVHPLWSEADRPGFLRERGANFEILVTTAPAGADAPLIAALPGLRAVVCRGVGVDAIDLGAARRRNIVVSNTPGVLTGCVADAAVGALIAAARGLCAADRFVRRGDWLRGRFPATTRVHGKRLGIVGLGAIGRAVARRAAGFDLDVRYHNRRPAPDTPYVYEPSLAALARWCDFLMVCCSGGPETRGLISADILSALGPAGYLVNVARGSVVDEPALVAALVERRIAGAALDVHAHEPQVHEALLALDTVVLLPHLASNTRETFAAMEDLVLANLRSFCVEGRLLTPV